MAKKEATLLVRIQEKGKEILDELNLKTVAIGTVAAFTADKIKDFLVEAFRSFSEAEAATNKLNQALVNQGIYTSELSKEYRDLASELQKKTAFSDEEIMGAQATMQAYLGQTKVSRELLTATLNLAAAKGIDLKSAADAVGKSIGTSTNALARQGIEIDANASKAEKLAQVTTVLNSKYRDQAQVAGDSGAGLQRLSNVAGELMEKIGGTLMPLVSMLAQKLQALSETIDENEQLWRALHMAVYAFGATFSVIEMVVKTVIGNMVEAYTLLGDVVYNLVHGRIAEARDVWIEHSKSIANRTIDNFDKMVSDVSSLYDKHMGIMEGKFRKEEDLLRQSEQRKLEIQKEKQAEKEAEQQKAYEKEQEERQKAYEKEQADFELKSEQEMMRLDIERQIRADADAMAKLEALNRQIAFETDRTAVIQAEEEKRLFLKQYYDKAQAKLDEKAKADKKARDEKEKQEAFNRADAADKFDMIMKDKQMVRATDTMNYLSRMTDSKSKELNAIGRAAATAQIIMQTAQAVMNVWGWASQIPFAGPAIAIGLSTAIVAYGAEQIGRVNSAQMAEGGIVTAREGGMLATIGEGGRDEAVIPLEDGKVPGMGGSITVNVYGGLLGDDASAYELARAIDRQLRRLEESGDRVSGG